MPGPQAIQKVYKIWSEWDIGEEYVVFLTKEIAMNWLRRNPYMPEILQEWGDSIESLIQEGMVSIVPRDLIIE